MRGKQLRNILHPILHPRSLIFFNAEGTFILGNLASFQQLTLVRRGGTLTFQFIKKVKLRGPQLTPATSSAQETFVTNLFSHLCHKTLFAICLTHSKKFECTQIIIIIIIIIIISYYWK